MAVRVMILAGGTGGHIFPALAVAERLRQRGCEVYWMGTKKGMEASLVPRSGFEVDWLPVTGLRGQGWMTRLQAPAMLVAACCQAVRILSRRKPNVVLGMGGFVAGPGGLMAALMRIPLVIHEQNRIPGVTNQFLARIARRVLEAFPETFGAERKALWTGNPLRAEIGESARPESRDWGRAHRILVIGGSQGALVLNRTVPAALAAAERMFDVRHQSGEAMLAETRAAYEAAGISARVEAFIEDMPAAYHWADLAICRAGAMTVSELAACGLPAILVPYPYAVNDHQTANARFLADAGAALLMPQDRFDAQTLAVELSRLLDRETALSKMAKAARSLARLDASDVVADICRAEAR